MVRSTLRGAPVGPPISSAASVRARFTQSGPGQGGASELCWTDCPNNPGRYKEGYCQMSLTADSQAAGCCLTPSTKTVPLTTSGRSVEPFNARHFFDADSI